MMKPSTVFMLLSILLVSYCSKSSDQNENHTGDNLTLDFTTDSSFVGSIQKMQNSLDSSQKHNLNEDLIFIATRGVEAPQAKYEIISDPTKLRTLLLMRIQGLTGEEILAFARSLKRKEAIVKIDQSIFEINNELRELEESNADANIILGAIRKIEIVDEELVWDESKNPDSIGVRLRIVNTSGYTISKIEINIVVASPGREIPWVEETYYQDFVGGFESGEDRKGFLRRGVSLRNSGWYRLPKNRDDFVLNVIIRDIDGPNLPDISSWSIKKDFTTRIAEQSAMLEKLASKKSKLISELK
jgi:hypothetical protein